jgi:hypothetical protein
MTCRVPEISDRRGPTETEDAQVLPAARARYDDVIPGLGTEMAATLPEGLAARADRVLAVTWPMPDSVDMGAQCHRALQRTAHLPAEPCHLVITPTPRHGAATMRPPLEIITCVRSAGILSSPAMVPRDDLLGGDARLGAEEAPLLPLPRSDRVACTNVFACAIKGIVATGRPGLLPARARGIAVILRRMLRNLPSAGRCVAAQVARPNSFPTSGSGGARERDSQLPPMSQRSQRSRPTTMVSYTGCDCTEQNRCPNFPPTCSEPCQRRMTLARRRSFEGPEGSSP